MPRWGKSATLVAALAENGLYTRHPVIINRCTVENDVFLQKLTDQKVLIAYPRNSYVVRVIFETWLAEVSVPDFERRRASIRCTGR
jgi:hypothetical protein